MFLSFQTDRSGKTVQTQMRGAVWSGSTLFAVPSASFGWITLRKSHLVQLLGWLQQIFRCPNIKGHFGYSPVSLFNILWFIESNLLPFNDLRLIVSIYSTHFCTDITVWLANPDCSNQGLSYNQSNKKKVPTSISAEFKKTRQAQFFLKIIIWIIFSVHNCFSLTAI